MGRLSLLSACIFALFLASCGGGISSGGGSSKPADSDSDGIPDFDVNGEVLDKCPNSKTPGFVSVSTSTDPNVTITDYDSDGCEDAGEDKDDDNDGVNDFNADGSELDKCPKGNFFTSTTNTDYDGDGCRDQDEDDDDDGDGITDTDNDNDGFGDAVDIDDDNNGLIEIATATELNNIRHDLDGTHYDKDEDDDGTDNIGSNAGCPTTNNPVGCKGYELANDISLAENWSPIAGVFSATLEGNDKTISNLTIYVNTRNAGFFAHLGSGSTVQNLSFTGDSVSSSFLGSQSTVGVLAGLNSGTISGVSVKQLTGSVNGGKGVDYVGGLIGVNNGTIRNSSATGSVNGGKGVDYVGGLVGFNFSAGIVQNSSATGSVNGGEGRDESGGLIGVNGGIIADSYATGNVVRGGGGGYGENVGGLVGYNRTGGIVLNSYVDNAMAIGGDSNDESVGSLVGCNCNGGFIINSYATGSSANGGAGNDTGVGGLVGYNGGEGGSSIINSYAIDSSANGDVGDDTGVGGLVGYNGGVGGGSIINSYATGSSANGGKGDDIGVGGLVGYSGGKDGGSILNSYAIDSSANGDVGDDTGVGGLVGFIDSGTIGNSYSSGSVDGGTGSDTVGRLLGKKGTGTITITSNYYNSESALLVVSSEDTELALLDAEAVGKTKAQLKAINLDTPDNQAACTAAGGTWDTANTDPCTSGNLTGWNAFDWEFQAGFYPTLKSYKVENNSQVEGDLLCGQLPEADFVQCPTPTP